MEKGNSSLLEKMYAKRSRRSEGAWPWILQRVSGIAIAILLFLHLWIKHFGNPGKVITFESSAERLHQPLWLVLALMMVAALVFHSFQGIRSIVLDYVTGNARRRILFWSFLGGGMFFFLVYVLFLIPFLG